MEQNKTKKKKSLSHIKMDKEILRFENIKMIFTTMKVLFFVRFRY